MEIWLIENREKTGPFQSYEVRSRIERGELSGGEMAWHQSSSDWVPLREMELFRAEFEVVEEELDLVLPPPLPIKPRPFVRFWARWFDFLLNMVVVFGLMRLLSLDMAAALLSPAFMLLYTLPWLMLESIAIHLVGTTPGKYLLGIRVQCLDGTRLSLGVSVLRAFRVYVLGMGMVLWIFPLICHCLSLWVLLKTKMTFWDRVGGTEVRVTSPAPVKIVVFVVLFLSLMSALSAITKPATDEVMKDFIKDNPQFAPLMPEDEA